MQKLKYHQTYYFYKQDLLHMDLKNTTTTPTQRPRTPCIEQGLLKVFLEAMVQGWRTLQQDLIVLSLLALTQYPLNLDPVMINSTVLKKYLNNPRTGDPTPPHRPPQRQVE